MRLSSKLGEDLSINEEAAAIAGIRNTLGFRVLVRKVTKTLETNSEPIPVTEPNWERRTAERQGRAATARALLEWLEGRIRQDEFKSPTEA